MRSRINLLGGYALKISIITCTWNSISTLRQTVESVVAQRDVDIEHIFVDGGSTDGTLEYIQSLPYRHVLLRDVGGGIARAMNEGAGAATGEFLCHLHSDDYFLSPIVLRRVRDLLADGRHDWLFGRILIDIDGALMPESFKVPDYSFRRLVQGNFIPHPATFVRTSLFNQMGGFNEALRFAMDYEFFLRLGSKHEPLALKEAFAVFRVHAGSTTVKNRVASFEEDHQVRLRYAGRSPGEQLMHAARYAVRKRRLRAALVSA